MAMYSRYSVAGIVSVLGQCTASAVGLRVSVYSRYSGADSGSVQQVQRG
jgi:hypothetical protein